MSFRAGAEGVLVSAVEPDSVAGKAGVQVNDLVLGVNRYRVNSLDDLKQARQRGRVKDSVLLLLQRGETNLYVALPVDN